MKNFIELNKYDGEPISINVNDIIVVSNCHIEVREVGGYDVMECYDVIIREIREAMEK